MVTVAFVSWLAKLARMRGAENVVPTGNCSFALGDPTRRWAPAKWADAAVDLSTNGKLQENQSHC